jgi:hypothetical protein
MFTQATSLPGQIRAIVVDGDVIGSRNIPNNVERLDKLCVTLNQSLAGEVKADFKRTKGDEIQGLLQFSSNPLKAYLRCALVANRLPMRWALVSGLVNIPTGPATDGDGEAYVRASSLLDSMRNSGELLHIETGDVNFDHRLAVFAPWIGDWVANLTDQQRAVLEVHLISAPEVTQHKTIALRAGVSSSVVSKVLNNLTNQRMFHLLDFIVEDLGKPREGN